MDPIGDDLLRTIRTEIGYREGPGQNSKFGEWYSINVVKDPQYRTAPWCGMLIAWAAEKAGVQQYVGQFAWTPSQARWFETNGAWSRTPEPGALVFFDWSGGGDISGIDHVGVVERVEGGTIHTIEGNVDRVWLKRKKRDQDKVVGYGLPRKVKENLAAAVPGEDGAPGQASGRIDVRPAPAREAVSLTAVSQAPPVSVETAVIAGLLTFVLGMTFVLSRRRPRVSAGRHRRSGGWRRGTGAPIGETGPRTRTREAIEEAETVEMAGATGAPAGEVDPPGASPAERPGDPVVAPHLYEAVRATRPGWAYEPYRTWTPAPRPVADAPGRAEATRRAAEAGGSVPESRRAA